MAELIYTVVPNTTVKMNSYHDYPLRHYLRFNLHYAPADKKSELGNKYEEYLKDIEIARGILKEYYM